VLNIPNGAPDAATRFIANKTANTTNAWYFGDLNDSGYDPASSSANLPGNTALTPGEDLVLPKIVINEVVLETWTQEQTNRFNPSSYRYIEIRSAQPHTSLQNVFLITLSTGSIANLSGYQTDENGLFLLGAPQVYQGLTSEIPHLSLPSISSYLRRSAFWLSYNPGTLPPIHLGKSWEEMNGNFLDILQGGYLLDGLVINHQNIYEIEGASIPLPNNDFNQRTYAASRVPSSMHPNTFMNQSAAPDWYYGRLETFYAYDDTSHSPNTPVNAMITPLEANGRTHNGEAAISYFGFETDEMTLAEGDNFYLNFHLQTSDNLLNIYKTTVTPVFVTEESTAIPGTDFAFEVYGQPPHLTSAIFDFGLPSGSNVFTETKLTIDQDQIIEETETIVLETLIPSNPNTAYRYRRLVIHILDNTVIVPPPPVGSITLSKTRLKIQAGTRKTYTIVLDAAPYENVVVTMTAGQRCRVNPQTLTFTTENWNVPQQVNVRARNFPNTSCVVRHESEGGGFPPIGSDSTVAEYGMYAHLDIPDVRVQIVP
jgi:hypothetical protein